MDFLKRHLFLILCGVAAVGGVALAVTGMGAMPKVVAELDGVARLYNDLGGLQGKPVNQRVIDENQKHIDAILADRNAVFEKARQLYKYEPLVVGVFPDGDAEKRREFRKVYNREMRALWDSLKAGRPAIDLDIEAMKEKIADDDFNRSKLGSDAPAEDEGEDRSPAGVLTKVGIRRNAAARAHLAAAQRIYLYGVHFDDAKPPELESALYLEASMKDTGSAEAPELLDCWRAQLSFWINKDVVEAIVAVNEEAAAAARDRGEDRWVGMMPIKELISLRTSKGYVTPSDEVYAGAVPGGYGLARPPATPKSVFTQSACNETFEVMQFTVKLVMDERDVLRFLDKLCGNGFHTVLRTAYRSVDLNREMVGKIYGSEPAINVVIDVETILLGDVFRPILPNSVCEEYSIPCEGMTPPKPKEDEVDEG